MQRQKASKDIRWETRKFPLVVLAENIHTPSNVGLIIRGCECFGVDRLYFTGGQSNTDTYKFKKAARSAQQYLDIERYESSLDLIEELKKDAYTILALEITDNGQNLKAYPFSKNAKYAIIIGSERHGIDANTLKDVDDALYIEQFGKTGSLNVGMALNISLFQITNQLI